MKLITEASADKLRGGFYTPETIAEFVLSWGINGSSDFDILEPSCGDGVFLEQLQKQKFKYKSITAIELDEEEASKADKINLKNKQLINDDFHIYCNNTDKRFDLVEVIRLTFVINFLIDNNRLKQGIFLSKRD